MPVPTNRLEVTSGDPRGGAPSPFASAFALGYAPTTPLLDQGLAPLRRPATAFEENLARPAGTVTMPSGAPAPSPAAGPASFAPATLPYPATGPGAPGTVAPLAVGSPAVTQGLAPLYYRQAVPAPAYLVTQPQVQYMVGPRVDRHDLGPLVPAHVAAAQEGDLVRRCLGWGLLGAALALLLRPR